MTRLVGTIGDIHRHPVKSMAGEVVSRSCVGFHGLAGDRALAVFDERNVVVASAREKRFAPLLRCTASFLEEPTPEHEARPVLIRLPDGHEIRHGDEDAGAAISRYLGVEVILAPLKSGGPSPAGEEALRRVREHLERVRSGGEPRLEGTVFDHAALHVLSTSTLDRLAAGAGLPSLPARRLRPNLLIDPAGDEPFDESRFLGATLAIGDQVLITLSDPTPRCVIPTLPQDDLPRAPEVLEAVARDATLEVPTFRGTFPCAGAYAFVIRPGVIRRGDSVRLVGSAE